MKKFIAILLTLALALGALSIPAMAETIVASGSYGNINWSLTIEGTLTVSGKGEIPSIDNWLDYTKDVKSVVIAGSITSIGKEAFRYCQYLTSVTIPDSVTSIGYGAFYGCSALTSLDIPNSVISIGDYAFYDCCSLISATIGNRVPSIGNYAFWNCFRLTSIDIPNSVTSIGERAFYYCSALISITLGSGVASIGEYAFHFPELETITVRAGNPVYHSKGNCLIETKSKTLVLGCKNSIIPDYITSIGDGAFSPCRSLERINIPEGVTTIGQGAFWGCLALTSITLPNSVTSIEDSAFYYCSSLTSITIPSAASIGDLFKGCSSLANVTLGNGVTSIGDNAFNDCDKLTCITIPDSVTSIGRDAFWSCSSLESITIGRGVNYIKYPFSYCYELKLVYVRSPYVAGLLTDESSAGGLITNAKTIILAEGVSATGYIRENYPFKGAATIGGENVVWYKTTDKCAVHLYEDSCDADCNICGYTRKDAHSYSGWSNDATQHWHQCTLCGEKVDAEEHIYYNACDTDCNVCGFIRQAPHLYKSTWERNDAMHWHECEFCGDRIDSSFHNYSSDNDTDCNTCGFVRDLNAHESNLLKGMTYEVVMNMYGTCTDDAHTLLTDGHYRGDGDHNWNDSAAIPGVSVEYAGTYQVNSFTFTFDEPVNLDTVVVKNVRAFFHDNSVNRHGHVKSVEVAAADGAFAEVTAVSSYVVIEGAPECAGADQQAAPQYYDIYVQLTGVENITGLRINIDTDRGNGTNAYILQLDEIEAYGTTHRHIYSSWYGNGTQHWHQCEICGEKVDVASHDYDNACDTDCNTCGYTRAIKHNYKQTWDSDDNKHWHECEICGNRIDTAAHSYDDIFDADCNICGAKREAALRGDTNGDGVTDNLDALMILKSEAGGSAFEGAALAAADVNRDGKVNNLDASLMLQFDAGLISEF